MIVWFFFVRCSQTMPLGMSTEPNIIAKPTPVKERKKHDRFNGMSEEEVSKRTLPDHLANNLDIIIVSVIFPFYHTIKYIHLKRSIRIENH